LGAAWYLPEERSLNSTDQILDEMCAALGGRAAEQVVFEEITTGALSDLEKVTKQAYSMVSIYGLNEAIGNISFYDSRGNSDYNFQKPYSDKTAELMDSEVKKIVDKQYDRAKELLRKNKDKLTLLAEQLLEKEVIFKEDLVKIFGKRPFEKEELLIPEGNEKKAKPESEEVAVDEDTTSAVHPSKANDNGSAKTETEETEKVTDGDITKKD